MTMNGMITADARYLCGG